MMLRVVCLSDTHNCNETIVVPDGDVLIHSGDATTIGSVEQLKAFNRWFAGLPHKRKIFVAGNHDWLFEKKNDLARRLLDPSIIYLQDSSTEINGLNQNAAGTPQIVIDGSAVTSGGVGLRVTSADNTISNLIIVHFIGATSTRTCAGKRIS